MIETERLLLRSWKESDIIPMISINQDPDVMEFYPAGKYSAEKTRSHIARFQKVNSENGYTLWAVELKETGEFIGYIGLMPTDFEADFTPAVEIGWKLNKYHWNKGLATEGGKAVIEYAFAKAKLTQIVSFTTEKNLRSRRVMEKIGMEYKSSFQMPKLPDTCPLKPHVLYEIIAP